MSRTKRWLTRCAAVALAMMLACVSVPSAFAEEAVAAESVELSRDALTLRAGSSFRLKAQPLPVKADMSDAVWSSDNEAVVTVEDGVVTGVAKGKATVTVTVGELSDTCEVTVAEEAESDADLAVESLLWTGGDGQVTPGTSLTFQVRVKNVGTADVTGTFYVDISAGQNRLFRLVHMDGVKAGETVALTSGAWKAVEGDYMMAVRVNPTLSVPEADEQTNNVYQIGLRVANDRLAPADETVAAIVKEHGLTNLTFSDDFDTLDTVDTLAGGQEGYKWYVTRRWAQTDMTRDDYFVQDGVMTIQHEDCTYAIGASTVDPVTGAGYTFTHGYLEFRIRMPKPDKNTENEVGKPAVWSLPTGKWLETPGENVHWVEVDWIEYYGDDYYTISMHEQEKSESGLNWYKNSNAKQYGFGDGDWHTLGFLWVEGKIVGYYDGEEIFSQTYSADDMPDPPNDYQSGEIRFDGVFDILDTQELVLYLAGGIDAPMEIDYLRIWQTAAAEPVIPAVVNKEPTGTEPLWLIGVAVVVVGASTIVEYFISHREKAKRKKEQE